MIAITGATGKLGQLVIQNLLKKTPASGIVAIVRNPAKAEDLKKLGVNIRQANYDQADSWASALSGVKKLLLISSSEVGKREAQHNTVIRAATEARVEHLAYTSILKADTSTLALAQEHLATEKAIKESGIPFTFLRNGWYLENHTETLAAAIENGALHGAAKDGRFSSASREDYALAAVAVLAGSRHTHKIYELAGDTSFSLKDLATEVSKQFHKSVTYQDHSLEDYKKLLISFGLPEPFADVLADADVGASKGGLHSESKDLKNLIGRPTTPLADAVKKALL